MVGYANALLAQKALSRLARNNVSGAIVEVGVWKGGMSCYMALSQQALGQRRHLWMFDTFEGMPPPGLEDGSRSSEAFREETIKGNGQWIKGALDVVRHTMEHTAGVPTGAVNYVEGKVEETLQNPTVRLPSKIALLRLDTDWYSSTKLELDVLWPRLQPGGWLYIDDYEAWEGARKAVDEWLYTHNWTLHARAAGALPVRHKIGLHLWKANPYDERRPFETSLVSMALGETVPQ